MKQKVSALVLCALLGFAAWGLGAEPPGSRCGTGLRGERPEGFAPLRPARRTGSAREAVPVPILGASVHATEHFRVLWGDGYDRLDPEWADPDGDGVPTWVEALADAMEAALAIQRAAGFPDPYGADRYCLDAYVGNTGVLVDGYAVTLGAGYYAYTEIDAEFQTAYFVFGDDYALHTGDELGVLRATAAHELFHAVQRADYPWDDELAVPDARWAREGWWFEATATWMEEVCAPEVDDYAAFVRRFLAAPQEPLTAMDGSREYGAAIFPGYLWLRHGGADLWQAVFRDALAAGVEPALGAELGRRGAAGLAEVAASFWARAAQPESTWPDGEQYRSAGSPRLLRSAASLPLSVDVPGGTAPGHLGANLLRVVPGAGPLTVAVTDGAEIGGLWVGAWDGAATSAAPASEGGAPLGLDPAPGSEVYLALVNTAEARRPFRIVVSSETGSGADSGAPTADSGGGGGCFLGALDRR